MHKNVVRTVTLAESSFFLAKQHSVGSYRVEIQAWVMPKKRMDGCDLYILLVNMAVSESQQVISTDCANVPQEPGSYFA